MHLRHRLIAAVAVLVAVLVVVLLTLFMQPTSDGDGAAVDHKKLPDSAPALRGARPVAQADPKQGSKEVVALTVRDLGDGEPVEGVRVTWFGDEVSASNQRGEVMVPRGEIPRVQIADDLWTGVHHSPQELLEGKTIWVYRMVTVEGILETGDAGRKLDFKKVRVRTAVGGDPSSTQMKPTSAPWNQEWFVAHGIPDPKALGTGRIDAQGRFSFRTPFVRWLVVAATAKGWRPSIVDVPEPSRDDDRTFVRVLMRPALAISGILRDRQGKPLTGAIVRLMIHERLKGPINVERLQVLGYAFSAVGDPIEPYVDHEIDVRTDAKGRYSFEVAFDGECWLAAHAARCRPVILALGSLSANESDVNLVADELRGPRPYATVTAGKRKLPDRKLGIVDVTNLDLQVLVQVTTDSSGRFPAEWMVKGRNYLLYSWYKDDELEGQITVSGFLKWDEREAIDLEKLVQHPEELER